MNTTDRAWKLVLVESSILLGAVSTLLTWFAHRVEPYPCILLYIDLCPRVLIHRGLPFTWLIEIPWPSLSGRPEWSFVRPPIIELKVEWLWLIIDLLAWIFLFALLLTLVMYKPKLIRRIGLEASKVTAKGLHRIGQRGVDSLAHP